MKRFLFLLVCLMLFGVVAAQDESALDYQSYTLDNGLDVILVQDNSAPVVAVNVWYRVGGANDPQGRSGFAHLFEHMMFQGTANLNKDALQRLIEAAGGTLNAYTSTDITAYYEALPAHQLPLGLWLEADRMASLAVTQTNLDNQRAVVIEEYQQRYGNSPYGLGILQLLTQPYTYAPYQQPVIGSIPDLNAASLEEVRDFHATYYLPNNATLVVVGDIDFDETRSLIDMLFGPIPAGEQPPALPAWEPVAQTEPEVMRLEDDLISVPAVLIGYEMPPRQHPDYPALQVLDYILSTGDASRMSQALLDTGKAVTAYSLVLDNYGPSLFGVLLLPNSDYTPEDLEADFYAELDRIAAEGVPQAELEKTINQLRAGRISGLESVFALSEQVQAANFFYDDPDAVFTEIARYEDVTSEDVQRVIGEYLAPEDRHVIYVEPGEPVLAEDPEPFIGATGTETDDAFEVDFALSITEPPAPLPLSEFTFPNIVEATLDNGLDVIVVESPELPVVSVDLYFRGGGSLVPAELAGLEGVTASLLTRGTETRTAQEIAALIEQEGGSISAGASNDSLNVGVFSLVEDIDLAFDLLRDVTMNPTFPQSELDVITARLRTSLENTLSDPGELARRTFFRQVYGAHPYGNTQTEATIDAITRDAVVDYYAGLHDPRNAFVVIAGDVNADEALAYVESAFGDWQPEGEPPTPTYPELDSVADGVQLYLVDVPGAAQAEVYMGGLGVMGDNPDRYDIQVMNNILGVGFTSRLFQNIREDKGYSYGIGSGYNYPVDRGTFRIATSVRSETVDEALTEIFKELDRLKTEPVGDEELASVRDGMIGRYALQLETVQSVASQVASFKLRDIPSSELSIYIERLAAVDSELVQETAQTYIPDDLIVIVSGDASVIQDDLETLGTVTLLPAE